MQMPSSCSGAQAELLQTVTDALGGNTCVQQSRAVSSSKTSTALPLEPLARVANVPAKFRSLSSGIRMRNRTAAISRRSARILIFAYPTWVAGSPRRGDSPDWMSAPTSAQLAHNSLRSRARYDGCCRSPWCPRAARPAMTMAAPARRSQAWTGAPVSLLHPFDHGHLAVHLDLGRPCGGTHPHSGSGFPTRPRSARWCPRARQRTAAI